MQNACFEWNGFDTATPTQPQEILPVGVVRERPVGERAVHEPPLQTTGITETIFRASWMKITLKRDEYKKDKRHGWLKIG